MTKIIPCVSATIKDKTRTESIIYILQRRCYFGAREGYSKIWRSYSKLSEGPLWKLRHKWAVAEVTKSSLNSFLIIYFNCFIYWIFVCYFDHFLLVYRGHNSLFALCTCRENNEVDTHNSKQRPFESSYNILYSFINNCRCLHLRVQSLICTPLLCVCVFHSLYANYIHKFRNKNYLFV